MPANSQLIQRSDSGFRGDGIYFRTVIDLFGDHDAHLAVDSLNCRHRESYVSEYNHEYAVSSLHETKDHPVTVLEESGSQQQAIMATEH